VEKLCREAEAAVRGGSAILIISDETADVHTLPIPSLLAVGAVHHHLIRCGLRMHASLVAATGEAREVHHFAALLGYGANAVYPYLAFASIADIIHEGRKTGALTEEQAVKNFVKAVDKGLLKIMSKMGISTLDSYCGAQIFEAVGIGQERCWTWPLWTRPACSAASASPTWPKMCWPGMQYGYPAQRHEPAGQAGHLGPLQIAARGRTARVEPAGGPRFDCGGAAQAGGRGRSQISQIRGSGQQPDR
jgi:hypothetical protein